jgi:hypothetical protein
VTIIGFGYKARQGKDTAALAMLELCPLDTWVKMYAFADALRKEVNSACAALGGPFNLVDQFKEAGLMPEWVHAETQGKQRSILQWWGTNYRRAKDPEYWVKRLRATLDNHKPDLGLITDVRFPNECAAVKAWGGVLVKVTRLGKPDIEVPTHPSETALDTYTAWDYHIQAATVAELKEQVKEIYADIQSGSCYNLSPLG